MKRTRGAALVITVWLIALATIMALNYSLALRSDSRITGSQLATLQARAAAEAGIWRAIYALDSQASPERWPSNGRLIAFDFDGIPVELVIQNLGGLADLNSASEQVLRQVMSYVFDDPKSAAGIVGKIIDWRDRDRLVEPEGAEDGDYRAAGLAYTAKDGAFNTREEMQLLLGVNLADYRRIAPFITVHGQNRTIDINAAPARVRAALGVEAGPSGSNAARAADSAPASEEKFDITATLARRRTFEIFARASVNGVISRLAAVVEIRQSRRRGPKIAILDWRETWPVEVPLEDVDELPTAR